MSSRALCRGTGCGVQGSRDIRQAPHGNWLLGLAGRSLWGLWGLPVTSNGTISNAASSPECPAEPECQWAGTRGMELGGLGRWELFALALTPEMFLNSCPVSTPPLFSLPSLHSHTLTQHQLQSFGPGNITWVVSLVFVLQMPSGHRQHLWAECKARPAPLQVLHAGEGTHQSWGCAVLLYNFMI